VDLLLFNSPQGLLSFLKLAKNYIADSITRIKSITKENLSGVEIFMTNKLHRRDNPQNSLWQYHTSYRPL
jgi:hypothetical protein